MHHTRLPPVNLNIHLTITFIFVYPYHYSSQHISRITIALQLQTSIYLISLLWLGNKICPLDANIGPKFFCKLGFFYLFYFSSLLSEKKFNFQLLLTNYNLRREKSVRVQSLTLHTHKILDNVLAIAVLGHTSIL